MSNIHLLKLNFNDNNFSIIRNVRKNVFADELGISESKLFDEYDETCDHFILFDGKNAVGSVRFMLYEKTIKLERMAILQEYRKNSYGKNSILQLREFYNSLGYTQIFLDSIYSVRGFYKKCGFLEQGKIFQRVGIKHVRMSLSL
jgi:predicted GNAT family N-acyltransferase